MALVPLEAFKSTKVTMAEGSRHLAAVLCKMTSFPTKVIHALNSNYLDDLNSTQRGTVYSVACGGVAVYIVSRWCRRKRQDVDPDLSFRSIRRARGTTAGNVLSISSTHPHDWSELQRQSLQTSRQGLSDQDTMAAVPKLVDGTPLTAQQLGLMGMEAFETVVDYWEEALSTYHKSDPRRKALLTSEEATFIRMLEHLLETAYRLQEQSEALFISQSSILNCPTQESIRKQVRKSGMTAETPSSRADRPLSVSSVDNESFVSAEESVADLRDFEDDVSSSTVPDHVGSCVMYREALHLVQHGKVEYRAIRTQFVGCTNSTEYLAQLHCLRLAFSRIMSQEESRQWWIETSRKMLSDLMVRADRDPRDFQVVFDELIEYLHVHSNIDVMKDELIARNVKTTNFYDVVLDYILIDSFEDLDSPPSSVVAVMRNSWLSNSFKKSALSTAIWSVLKAKRRMLKVSNGFKAQFYNLSELLTPAIAWGFFGPDEELRSLVLFFKEQVLGFIRDLHDFGQVRFTSVEDLSQDIMRLARQRLETTLVRLEETPS